MDDADEEEREELRARLVIARAALERVDELARDWTRDGTVERVRRLYEFRQRRFKILAGKIEDEGGLEERLAPLPADDARGLRRPARALVGLRNGQQISSEVMRRVEHELDLEESRLEV